MQAGDVLKIHSRDKTQRTQSRKIQTRRRRERRSSRGKIFFALKPFGSARVNSGLRERISLCGDKIQLVQAISRSARAKSSLRGHFSVCAGVAASTRRQTETF